MAMIDAYRIGVELVLGGDLAAGLDALIPGLERLDAGITHANAEAAELATGLHDVAEAAPGIGRAADEMGRLSAAMASVNQAAEAWRSHPGLTEVSSPGEAEEGAGTPQHRAPASGGKAALPHEAPAVVADLGVGDGSGDRSKPGKALSTRVGLPSDDSDIAGGLAASQRANVPLQPRPRPTGGLGAVMPALMAGELVKTSVAGRFDGEAKPSDPPPKRRALELMPSTAAERGRMPGADATKPNTEVYASAARVLPVYVRDAITPGRAEHEGVRILPEPLRAAELESVIEPGRRGFDKARVDAVEEVMPTLPRTGRSGAAGEVSIKSHHLAQQSVPMIDFALQRMAGAPELDRPVRERVVGVDAPPPHPSWAVEWRVDTPRALSAPVTASSASERPAQERPRRESPRPVLDAPTPQALQRLAATTLNGMPEWMSGVSKRSRTNPDGAKAALASLSSSVMALGASRVKDEVLGKTSEGRLNLAEGHAAIGSGVVPSLTAPYRERPRGMSVTPHSQGYHPQGDQPGPVIEHITYVHLDDREIARAVTRQQLRMMGGNVSGTLRPDPSIAPHYGAHLLET